MAQIVVTQSGTTVVVSNGDRVIIDIPGGGDVTIVAAPGSNVHRFQLEFVDDTESDRVNIDLSTFSRDNLHIDIRDYDPTDVVRLIGAFNRFVDPNDVDEYQFDYIGADGQTYGGYIHARDKGERDFTADPPPIIICFAEGTPIDTDAGPVAVERLVPGMLVDTLDHGPQPVKWVGRTRLTGLDRPEMAHLRPVRIRAGALGPGQPAADVVLSPNHRVLVSGWRAELHFGEAEVLVPVKSLIDGSRIIEETGRRTVTYYHLLLDDHQIVSSNGLLSESLFIADQSLLAVSETAERDLRSAVPPAELDRLSAAPLARPEVKVRNAPCLAA